MENVLEVMIAATFGCHVYKWGGKLYRQRKGGSIGLRLTGSISKVTMDKWMSIFQGILETHGIENFCSPKICRRYIFMHKNTAI